MIIKRKKIIRKKVDFTVPKHFGKKQLDYTVAEILLKHVINNQDNPVITYGELASKIDRDFNPRILGNYLGNISDVCKENDLPLVSGIVVNKETGLPGEGFYKYYYNERPISEWENIFEECKSSVIKCKLWKELLDAII